VEHVEPVVVRINCQSQRYRVCAEVIGQVHFRCRILDVVKCRTVYNVCPAFKVNSTGTVIADKPDVTVAWIGGQTNRFIDTAVVQQSALTAGYNREEVTVPVLSYSRVLDLPSACIGGMDRIFLKTEGWSDFVNLQTEHHIGCKWIFRQVIFIGIISRYREQHG